MKDAFPDNYRKFCDNYRENRQRGGNNRKCRSIRITLCDSFTLETSSIPQEKRRKMLFRIIIANFAIIIAKIANGAVRTELAPWQKKRTSVIPREPENLPPALSKWAPPRGRIPVPAEVRGMSYII